MSLDVYLQGDQKKRLCQECNGDGIIISREVLFDANITHNLNKMAEEAGIYEHLWRPDEIGVTHASQLIAPLTKALELMKSDPARFEKFNSPNGWGSYKGFVPWIEKYLEACKENPDAHVSVSR